MKDNPIKKLGSSLKQMRERHKARHRATGLGFAFADSVDYLDATRWDSICKDASVWMRRDVLGVIEQEGPDNLVPRYAMIFDGSELVAALAAQIVSVTGDRLHNADKDKKEARSAEGAKAALKRLMAPVKSAAASRVQQRMLVAGNLLCWGFHGIAIRPGASMGMAWEGIAEAIYRIRRSERLTGETNVVMIKDLTAAQSGMEHLDKFSYRSLETEPDMVLNVREGWKSYEDYLAALESKYRSNAKSQMKKLAAAGCVVERLAEIGAHADHLHSLYLNVQRNASIKLATVPATYLPALAGALGDGFRCNVVRRGEEILGFVTTVRDGSTAIAYYIGFNHEAAGEGIPIYLRLLHSTIADAIEWGCTRLSLGRTALEPKAAIGALPEPLHVWMRHRVPAMNWLMRGVLNAVPHNEPPERNPFKTTKEKET